MEYVSVVNALYLEFGHLNPSEPHICKHAYRAIENSLRNVQKSTTMDNWIYKRRIGFTNTNYYEDGQ